MNLVAGCDPGLDGAIAFLDPALLRVIAMLGMPAFRLGKTKGSKREISIRTLVVMIDPTAGRPYLPRARFELTTDGRYQRISIRPGCPQHYRTARRLLNALRFWKQLLKMRSDC